MMNKFLWMQDEENETDQPKDKHQKCCDEASGKYIANL